MDVLLWLMVSIYSKYSSTLPVSFHKLNFWDPHKWWINDFWNYVITWKTGVFSLSLSLLFAPSIILSSISIMVFSWEQALAKWPALIQFKRFEFIALHCFIWFDLKDQLHMKHFFLSLFFSGLLFFLMLQYEHNCSFFIAPPGSFSSPGTTVSYVKLL